jgi:hypothetical protein
VTAASPTSEPSTGLVHLGLLYDGVDDLVAAALPEIRSVLDAGGDVTCTVERGGVRELRQALGPLADRVDFPPPAQAYAADPSAYVARLSRDLPRDRRTLVVGQYSALTPPAWDCAYAEDAVNLVLADLPLTVLCACPRDGLPAHRELTTRSHHQLVGAGGRVVNAGFRAPASSSPAPLSPWGEPRATVTVGDDGGLSALRRTVTAVAAEAGLPPAARDTAVLAAHEAVLLAAGDDPDAAVPITTEQVVEIRAAAGAVVTEVRSPCGPGAADEGNWRRDLLPRFCDRLTTHRGEDGLRVRVLNVG